MTRIEELTKTAEQERVNAKELLTVANAEKRNGNDLKADALDSMARLCYVQAENAELEISVLNEEHQMIRREGDLE